MKLRVGIAGASGRMGRGIVKAVSEQPDMELVLAVDPGSVGMDVGEVAGVGGLGVLIDSPVDLEKRLEQSRAAVLVDFTDSVAALKNAETALARGVKLVIGTTGLGNEEIEKIRGAAKANNVPVVLSPNMSTGVNLFFKLVRDAAQGLGNEYDVEIVEVHHRNKKDAPSGTALRAGELIAGVLGRDLDRDGVYGRKGLVGVRSREEIGIHAVRAGDVVGEHTVMFAGPSERIEITHRAHSRDAFVNGVVKAIRFLGTQEGGRVYSTWDVLGIK